MRAHEFIRGYIDPRKITPRFRRELEDALDREGPPANPILIALMYGDPLGDVELEKAHLDLLSARAEIDGMVAAAERDRAEARELRDAEPT